MPKLWRAPMPMVRITAPQITATQKLRCCGAGAALDAATVMETSSSSGGVACMMVVTALRCVNAAQEFWQDVVSDRPKPGAGGRVVEHADHARHLAKTLAPH